MNESRNGRSLKRSTGAEYATTANTTTTSAIAACGVPSTMSHAIIGATVSTEASDDPAVHLAGRARSRTTSPSMPPLRGLSRSDS